MLGVVLVAIPTFKNMSIEKSNASLRGSISDLSYAQQVFDEYNSTTASYSVVRQIDEATITKNNELATLIEELEHKMPTQIRVLSLSAAENSVSLSIIVESKAAVADVIMQLRTFESIEINTISTISENKDDAGNTEVSFSISCDYVDSKLADEQNADGTIADQAAEVGAATDAATSDMENTSDEVAGE